MLDPDTTRQRDLRSGKGPWLAGPPRPNSEPLERDTSCDVAIVGAGITGALLGEHLTARGLDVVVIDRETEGYGSTAASTAMLQWEIDLSMTRLSGLYGFEKAASVYQRSFKAVSGLRALAEEHALHGLLIPRDTVYLAAGEVGPAELAEEFRLRERAGLPGQLLDHAALFGHFGFDRAGAIVSPGSAEADPLSLCHALLGKAAARGARFVRDEAEAYACDKTGAAVTLHGGATVEARDVVLATGYVMPDFITTDLHRVASSFAIATEPQKAGILWPGQDLVWEASEDYIYCRTTTDGRIVFGGEDVDYSDPEKRDAVAPEKREALRRKLEALIPKADATLSHSWSGAFGQTSDGLPLIGRVPGMERLLAAYGYGGNGITFSYLASRLLGELIAGEERPWFKDFALDRPDPS